MLVVGSVAIWRATATATCGLEWPTIAGPAEPDIVSRYIRPSASQTRAFKPRARVRQGSLRSECSTNLQSASISSPSRIRSGTQPARGHLPDGLDAITPDGDDLVREVAAGAAVERGEPQPLSH